MATKPPRSGLAGLLGSQRIKRLGHLARMHQSRLRRSEIANAIQRKLAERTTLLEQQKQAAADATLAEQIRMIDEEISQLQDDLAQTPADDGPIQFQADDASPSSTQNPDQQAERSAADRQQSTAQNLQKQMDDRARAAHEQEIARSMKQPPKTVPDSVNKARTGATKRGFGSASTQAKQRMGQLAKEGGQRAAQMARVVGRAMIQAAKIAARVLARLAFSLVRLMIMNPYVLGAILIIALIIGIAWYFAGSGKQYSNTDGSRLTIPAAPGRDNQTVAQILAATGDAQASGTLLKSSATGLMADYTRLETLLKTYPDSSDKQAALAQMQVARASSQKLITAAQQARDQTTAEKATDHEGVETFPADLVAARTAALRDIATLEPLIQAVEARGTR